MTTYTWPSTVVPNDMTVEFVSNAATFVSPFSGVPRSVARDAAVLKVTMQFRFLRSQSQSLGAAADTNTRSTLMGFLAKLNGPEHRVTLPMFIANNLGNWSGTPLVAGASQTGQSLNIDSAGTGAVSPYAFTGDWFTVNNELKICTDTVNMTADNATLTFWPPLRSAPPDNDPIQHSSPTGIFMLVGDPVWTSVPGPNAVPFGNCTVNMIEDPYA